MEMVSSSTGGGQLSVPPGFRFHPTEEELLYYYLKKKVSYEPIDLDVIREVDLNRLEPWELKDKCRIGSGPQNEWYFFSHKDKKYPTGTRTNRATAAGFWKATGRDKSIHLNSSKKIGLRKTLVFYTGRAPHGNKTDWIMHEYRLDDVENEIQEDGWVVCRVFQKKNHVRGFHQEPPEQDDQHFLTATDHHLINPNPSSFPNSINPNFNHHHQIRQTQPPIYDYNSTPMLHLPQLFSPDHRHHHQSAAAMNPNPAFVSLNPQDIQCSQNLLRLTSSNNGYGGDWSFLDKLLASTNQNHPHQQQQQPSQDNGELGIEGLNAAATAAESSSSTRFAFQYLGNEADLLKFSK